MSERSMPLDAYLTITVSEDKLTAFLQFTRTEEEFALNAAELEQFAVSHGIVFGLDKAKLEQIAADPKSHFMVQNVIASGTKPVDGENGYVRYLFDLGNNQRKPLMLEDGTVDFKELASINNVKKGQLIGERVPPQPGQDGHAVTGETLFAKDGKEAHFKIGKNVVLDQERSALYAAIDGMVITTDRDKVNVFPIYEINGDVDYGIGNIDFVGSVVIRGNVQPGFRIKAAGDIRITGGVEAAELEAGGSIEIGAGIVGQNKAKVRAGKSIKSSFIQDALVEAGEDIIVAQSIMHSTVRAGRSVICNGPKGLIVGGIVQAGEKVTSRTVGNAMSTVTVIEVGVVPELRNELLALRAQLKAQRENLDKTEKALALLDQLAAAGQLNQEKLSLRVKLNHTKKQSIEEETNIKERILEIEKSLEETERARVEVLATIYGGAKIVIGRYTKFVKDAVSRVVFCLSDGDVSMIPYF
ncbi:polymerase [Gordoniibacillus kamchatkensis]|uniref:Polymerase n=1 Tax=Gordoniibacillus kamchatkensis TaxID=1590651 RepID=A0ABR5ADV4_9BACL|nr:FapA family protein [Paenibacillus sp. VKM B-2647]KIL39223.1 polymerase [Paenibacillus sp. VKM B-2647]